MKSFEHNIENKPDAIQTHIAFNLENKKTWREEVGEKVFVDKMRELKIGPDLWNKVEIDNSGKVLTIDGISYKKWNSQMEKISGPDHPWG